jgi:hypothetical protein
LPREIAQALRAGFRDDVPDLRTDGGERDPAQRGDALGALAAFEGGNPVNNRNPFGVGAP